MKMSMTWYDSVGHECYQLNELKNTIEVLEKEYGLKKGRQYKWAIESLLEKLDVVGRALPNEYHPEVRGKK
tara:strand:+ start:32 stop:244 length:213 start_codon:yes stop_codon:yes gene_type:complete